jgi:hypothetical protein
MAYETVLNTPALIGSVNSSSVTSAGYASTLKLNISGTTLGPVLSCTLSIATSANSDYASLSAAGGVTSINLSLSSPTVLPTAQVWPGVISTSTYSNASKTATLTITFPQRSLLTTLISLSANATTTIIDPTKSSVIDNFFFLTGSPDVTHQVRTTGGQANLQAYLG